MKLVLEPSAIFQLRTRLLAPSAAGKDLLILRILLEEVIDLILLSEFQVELEKVSLNNGQDFLEGDLGLSNAGLQRRELGVHKGYLLILLLLGLGG